MAPVGLFCNCIEDMHMTGSHQLYEAMLYVMGTWYLIFHFSYCEHAKPFYMKPWHILRDSFNQVIFE